MHEILPDAMNVLGLQGRLPGQVRIRLVVAGDCGEPDAAPPTGNRDLLNAIGPIARAAEQAHDHQPGVRHHVFNIQVDRHVMTQLQEICETQARHTCTRPRLRAREGGKFSIRCRQKDDIARRLAEVDRFRPIGDNARRHREQMHF